MSAIDYFIADLHLSKNRPDITACFLSFLQNDAVNANSLYILGDLFEYWIGDDDHSPLTNDIAQGLSALAQRGVAIYFIHGNRDFLLGQKFAQRCSMTLLPELAEIDIQGQKAIILHGDTLCTRDVDYQAFRKKSRRWWWQAIIKSLPLFFRRKIAENYRKQSAESTALKPQDIMDVTEEEVVKSLEKHRCQLMIHGHTHRPAIHDILANNQPAQRIVLGDWYEQGSWLKISNKKIEILNHPLK